MSATAGAERDLKPANGCPCDARPIDCHYLAASRPGVFLRCAVPAKPAPRWCGCGDEISDGAALCVDCAYVAKGFV